MSKGRLYSKEEIDRQVGAILYRHPYRSYIWVETADGRLDFGINKDRWKEKELWAGVCGHLGLMCLPRH